MKPTLPKMDSAYTFIKAYRRSKGYSENRNRTFRDTRELLSVLDTISEHYEKHFVSKKNSDELRTVFSVSYPLREYQEFIRAQVLTPLDLAYTSSYAYAYRRGLSTKDNAKVHEKSRYMLKLDIRHFFESTRKRLVFATFEKYTSYNRSILGILTKLVCYNGALCQGACTSPTIANLVLADFDASVGLFCDGMGIRYSRYCDDMTFSSPFEFEAKKVEEFVRLQLKPLRYSLNDRKTRFFRPGQRLEVTGAVVNTRVRAPREYRQKIRQDLYYINKYGFIFHLEKTRPSWYSGKATEYDILHLLKIMKGRIAYVKMLDPDDPFASNARKELDAAALRHGFGDLSKMQDRQISFEIENAKILRFMTLEERLQRSVSPEVHLMVWHAMRGLEYHPEGNGGFVSDEEDEDKTPPLGNEFPDD